jgi:hypothetical protein
MDRPSPLEDPHNAAFAWRRYRRLMLWMTGAATMAVFVAILFLYQRNGPASIHLYIAAALGVFISVLLGAALMGLVFLSAGSGHDDAITDRLEEERDLG